MNGRRHARQQRKVIDVDDVNHYTIVMGRGAKTVASAISRYGAHP